jgi:hypothetical protein
MPPNIDQPKPIIDLDSILKKQREMQKKTMEESRISHKVNIDEILQKCLKKYTASKPFESDFGIDLGTSHDINDPIKIEDFT